jgi:two-component system phosphate regulon sensor histidine kinase PhoR
VWFRAPATVQLQRAQLTLMLATLIPTVLMTALGIVLLAVGSQSLNLNLVAGVLLLAFCTTSLTGYILGSIFVYRGASLARVQNDFVNSVSHELRTPLTSIRMFIETLRDDRVQDPAERRRCLDLIFTEVERLDGLVGRVIDLSRYDRGRMVVPQPVDVRSLFDEVIRAYEAATLSDPNPLEVELPSETLRVRGDRAALSLAIGNLLMNAYKYTRPGPSHIKLWARGQSRRWLEIGVVDDGPGIPWHERKRVFEEFERGAEAINRRTPGSGLGLSIVKAVVVALGGTVDLKSRIGKGTEVRLRLRRLP